jgi:hypothetical protein
MFSEKLKYRPSEKKYNGEKFIYVFDGTMRECKLFIGRAKERTGQGRVAYRISRCPVGCVEERDNPYTVYARVKRK